MLLNIFISSHKKSWKVNESCDFVFCNFFFHTIENCKMATRFFLSKLCLIEKISYHFTQKIGTFLSIGFETDFKNVPIRVTLERPRKWTLCCVVLIEMSALARRRRKRASRRIPILFTYNTLLEGKEWWLMSDEPAFKRSISLVCRKMW